MQEAFPSKKGSDLIELREHLGVEQKDIADVLKVTATTIYRWEHADEVKPLQYARYEAACRALLDRAARTPEAVA